MTESRQQNAPLVFGAIIAVILHLIIGGPILSASWGVGGKSPLDSALDGRSESERRQRERLEEALRKAREVAPKEDEVVPGLEDGSDEGMTWIGYAEYQEHLAQHSEVDQAAFTEQDAAGGGALAQGEVNPNGAATPDANAPAPPAQATQPNESQVAPQQPTAEAQATPQKSPQEVQPPTQIVEAPPNAAAIPPSEVPPTSSGSDLVPLPAIAAAAQNPTPTAEKTPTEALPAQTATPKAAPAEAAPTETAQTAPPQPAAEQTATSPIVSPVSGPPGAPGPSTAAGEKSDRESDATSIADVPPSTWRNGKPLARKGLEIKTKKPALPILTQISTRPNNPICEILFGRDGVPVSCTVLQSSGYAEIDGPVTDALYRWRAKGSQLDKLAPGKTLRFRIRFILN